MCINVIVHHANHLISSSWSITEASMMNEIYRTKIK